MTFDKRIQKVLEKHACHFKTIGMGFNTTISKEDYSLQSLSAIKTIIKESLPSNKEFDKAPGEWNRERDGWNTCLDEIHKRMGLTGKED